MRLASKRTLLALSAVAATALTAPPGFAQVEPMVHGKAPRLIVQDEAPGAPDLNCPAVMPTPPPAPGPLFTAGGCRLHVSAPTVVTSLHLASGAEGIVSTCAWEFDMRIDRDGEGYVSHQELTGPLATCTRRACGQTVPPASEGRAWSMYMEEREPGPVERMLLLYCLENRADGANPMHCEVEIPISQPTVHRYRLAAVDVSGHGTDLPHCEIDGTFDVEDLIGSNGEDDVEQHVEIRHI